MIPRCFAAGLLRSLAEEEAATDQRGISWHCMDAAKGMNIKESTGMIKYRGFLGMNIQHQPSVKQELWYGHRHPVLDGRRRNLPGCSYRHRYTISWRKFFKKFTPEWATPMASKEDDIHLWCRRSDYERYHNKGESLNHPDYLLASVIVFVAVEWYSSCRCGAMGIMGCLVSR